MITRGRLFPTNSQPSPPRRNPPFPPAVGCFAHCPLPSAWPQCDLRTVQDGLVAPCEREVMWMGTAAKCQRDLAALAPILAPLAPAPVETAARGGFSTSLFHAQSRGTRLVVVEAKGYFVLRNHEEHNLMSTQLPPSNDPDPRSMDALGAVESAGGLIASVAGLAIALTNLKERYSYAAVHITLVASSLWAVRAALEAVQEWRAAAAGTERTFQQLDHDLTVSLESCAVLVAVVERKLGETGLTEPTVYDKKGFVNLDLMLKDFKAKFEGQVRALQLLVTVFRW